MAKQVRANEADWIIVHGVPVYAVAHARATVRGNSTVDADLARLEEKMDASGSFRVTHAVVNTDAWVESEEGVEASIPVPGATSSTVPLICVHPDSWTVMVRSGMKSRCVAGAGAVTVYAQLVPSDAIELTILSMYSQSVENDVEVSAPEAPVIAYYKLPVATKDTLGGVKIGNNIDIAEDGTISAKGSAGCNHVLSGGIDDGSQHHVHDEECMKGLVAAPGEVDDALNRALGIENGPESA